jgi:hypothetical protein
VKHLVALLLLGCGGSVSSIDDTSVDSTATDSGTATVDSAPTDTFTATDTTVATDTFVADTPMRDAGWTDIAITGSELSPWEGKTIWFLIQNRVTPGELSRASTKIVGGVAKVTIPDTMPPDHFGVGVNIFIDLNDDAACNGTDPAWFDIATNMFGKSESPYTFKPSMATKIACSEIGK